MNEITLDKMRDELARLLGGRKFGRIFPLSRVALAIDFRLADGRFLFLSVEPAAPRVYLVERRLRDLEKQSVNLSPFLLFLRKRLSNAVVESVEKIANERVLVFEFSVITELGEAERYFLALQLTGRSANLLLLDRNRFILDKMRETFGPGQELGDSYSPPFREEEKRRR
ncbi:MAG: NFACT family protein, partial [Acidobacteria bacterium]|nr:NFACT family protein [Acidobacteriota bacterium]